MSIYKYVMLYNYHKTKLDNLAANTRPTFKAEIESSLTFYFEKSTSSPPNYSLQHLIAHRFLPFVMTIIFKW